MREELDLADVLWVVLRPVVRALLRPGELESISLEWATVRLPHWQPPPELDGDDAALRAADRQFGGVANVGGRLSEPEERDGLGQVGAPRAQARDSLVLVTDGNTAEQNKRVD